MTTLMMAALATLGLKNQLVRDHVTAVARRYKHGLFLYGSGGVGKSYTVLRRLEELDVPYRLFNSRMTAKGLFLAMAAAPDAVFVLEDMERVTKDPDAQGVLRSALWAHPGHPRVVTWTTATTGVERFEFRGGLILISNRPLTDLPELRALATRIEVYRMDATEAELTALIHDLAGRGYCENGQPVLTPEECRPVTDHLMAVSRAAGCPLDLRLQQKAFQTYRQFAANDARTHWEDLVASSVGAAVENFRQPVEADTPEAKLAQKRSALRQVMAECGDPADQVKECTSRTKSSRADFYRRKTEVEGGKFDELDAAYVTAAPPKESE